jgi:hypothetical protein
LGAIWPAMKCRESHSPDSQSVAEVGSASRPRMSAPLRGHRALTPTPEPRQIIIPTSRECFLQTKAPTWSQRRSVLRQTACAPVPDELLPTIKDRRTVRSGHVEGGPWTVARSWHSREHIPHLPEKKKNAYNRDPKAYSTAAAEPVVIDPVSGFMLDAFTLNALPVYLPDGEVNPTLIHGIVRCGD